MSLLEGRVWWRISFRTVSRSLTWQVVQLWVSVFILRDSKRKLLKWWPAETLIVIHTMNFKKTHSLKRIIDPDTFNPYVCRAFSSDLTLFPPFPEHSPFCFHGISITVYKVRMYTWEKADGICLHTMIFCSVRFLERTSFHSSLGLSTTPLCTYNTVLSSPHSVIVGADTQTCASRSVVCQHLLSQAFPQERHRQGTWQL